MKEQLYFLSILKKTRLESLLSFSSQASSKFQGDLWPNFCPKTDWKKDVLFQHSKEGLIFILESFKLKVFPKRVRVRERNREKQRETERNREKFDSKSIWKDGFKNSF